MGNGKLNGVNRMRGALKKMVAEDPKLAAELVLTAIPAAAANTDAELDYDLSISELGNYHIAVAERQAKVTPGNSERADFTVETDARTLAELAAGSSPLWRMLSGRLHVHGKRRKALKLRSLTKTGSMREVAKLGEDVNPDLVFRAIPYVLDPEWMAGHSFVVGYELSGEKGGVWFVHINDGDVKVTRELDGVASAMVYTSYETWLRLLSEDITPTEAMLHSLTQVHGELYPVTLLGRWLDRAEDRDQEELEREERQRRRQSERSGSWGAKVTSLNGDGTAQADPAAQPKPRRRSKGQQLLTYQELYALWERQNWSAHEIDFSVDREHWLVTPAESQRQTAWSLGSFYVGEERVAADLAPFVVAAPSGEAEAFLATQLVDEARHAVFFDRFGAEVMALDADDLRGRLTELQDILLTPWHEVFDDNLRSIANYVRDHPDDMSAFVEGVVIYHMVIEGVLAMTGQRIILDYMKNHGLFPGFREGFSLVERDEHRHIAFGVRFLKDAVDSDSAYGDLIERKIAELVPKAALVLVPPGIEDPTDFKSYDLTSAEVYGFAYKALKRRMATIGLSVPPPRELMPGPIEEPEVIAA